MPRYPEALAHGHQGERVMFSPPGHVTEEGFFGTDGLRIFMPAEAFCDAGPGAEHVDALKASLRRP